MSVCQYVIIRVAIPMSLSALLGISPGIPLSQYLSCITLSLNLSILPSYHLTCIPSLPWPCFLPSPSPSYPSLKSVSHSPTHSSQSALSSLIPPTRQITSPRSQTSVLGPPPLGLSLGGLPVTDRITTHRSVWSRSSLPVSVPACGLSLWSL